VRDEASTVADSTLLLIRMGCHENKIQPLFLMVATTVNTTEARAAETRAKYTSRVPIGSHHSKTVGELPMFVFKRNNEDQERLKAAQAYSGVAKQAALLFAFFAAVRAAYVDLLHALCDCAGSHAVFSAIVCRPYVLDRLHLR
jgi:hypothetical protein